MLRPLCWDSRLAAAYGPGGPPCNPGQIRAGRPQLDGHDPRQRDRRPRAGGVPVTMPGLQQPRPKPHGGRQPDLVLVLVDRWLYTAQLTRPLRRRRSHPGSPRRSPRQLCSPLALKAAEPPVAGQRWPTVSAPPVMSRTWGDRHQARWATKSSVPFQAPEMHSVLAAVTVATVTLALLLGAALRQGPALAGVPMWSSQARGVEGHQWRLHRTSGTTLPCRIVCQCGWTSAAGTSTSTLLELKGHLQDSPHNGAR